MKEVELFDKVTPQLEGFCHELRELTKKKPDGGINKFKLQIINEKLDEANLLLTRNFKPFKDFSRFDQDNLPTNSDVVLILSQYLECLETWRSAHVIKVDYSWYWNTPGDLRIRTDGPKRSHLDEEEEDGEGENFLGCALGNRKLARPVGQVRETGLGRQDDRVINPRRDALGLEMGL